MRAASLGCAVAVLLVLVPQTGHGQARAANRRALLIANSAYQHLPRLETPKPNVEALASALQKLHFQPKVAYDLPQAELISTVRAFTDTVQSGDFVLVFYSGYGYQADELNYILPVGFDPKDQSAPGLAAFSLRNLERRLEQRKAGTKMLVLDASRPAGGLPAGLAAVRPSGNTLVAFAAAPGQSAADPPGGGINAFTNALIRAIGEPGSKPAGVLERARTEVSRLSSGKQVPLVMESGRQDFEFNPLPVPVANGGAKGEGGAAAAAPNPDIFAGSRTPMWATDGGDARRSGFAPYRGPRKPRVLWSADAGNREPNSPLVGPDGRIYVWSVRDRMVRCVENGRVVWSLPLTLNDQVSFAPDGSPELTSFTGRRRVLNEDGKTIREAQVDARYLGLFAWQGHPYNSNGINRGNGSSTRFYLFRADDRRWQVEVDGQAVTPVVDDTGVLYTGTTRGTLYAVTDAATVLWTYPAGAAPVHGLAVTRNQEVLAAVGQSLYHVREGRLLWRFAGEGDGSSLPPIHDAAGTIYFGKGTDFYAVTAAGREVWRVRIGDTLTTAPAMDRSGRIYVASATKLYCIGD